MAIKTHYKRRTGMTVTIGKKRYKWYDAGESYKGRRPIFKRDVESVVRKLKKKGYEPKIVVRKGSIYHPKMLRKGKFVKAPSVVKPYQIYIRKKKK
jgi:hypothetical protein